MVRITARTRRVEGSFLNGFGRAAEQAIVDSFLRPLRQATEEFLHHTMTRVVAYGIAVVLLALGAVFSLYAAAEGLRSASLPKPAAYGLIGLASVLGGIVLVLAVRPKKES